VTYQNRAPAPPIGVPTPRVITESLDVHRLVQNIRDLICRSTSNIPPVNLVISSLMQSQILLFTTISDDIILSLDQLRDDRVTISVVVGEIGTVVSLSWCQPLLVSLSWFKPGERLSVANGWMWQYPWCKNTGAGRGTNPGEKATCRNSRTARNDSDQLGLDPVVIHVSQPLLESLACCGRPRPRVVIVVQTGVRHPPRVVIVVSTPPRVVIDGSNKGGNSRWQPRGVTTRVVIRGGRRTVRVVVAV
jgi:hypothetical protein